MRHECFEDGLELDGQADLEQSGGSIWHVFEDDLLPTKLHKSVER